MITIESKYLGFQERQRLHRKTKTIMVTSKNKLDVLGIIEWYGPWRQYCFWPVYGTVFNKGCLEDINKYITELMRERNDERRSRKTV